MFVELILRRDPRLGSLIEKFEKKDNLDMGFLEEVHDLIGSEAQALYDELFAETSLEVGKKLSKQEREDKELSAEKSLIYGEVEFASFYRILRKINPSAGGVFYDLGSGTGKAVFAARLTRDFDRCVGVEILSSLHSAAEAVVRRFHDHFAKHLSLSEKQAVSVFEGSFCDFDWSDGDLVFANSTCFSDELMSEVSRLAERLKPGAVVVTFTRGLTSTRFELLERRRYGMSWGPATVFIHRRLRHDGSPVGPAKLNVLPSDQRSYDDDAYNNETNVRPSTTYSQQQQQQHYDMADIDDEDDDDEEEDEEDEEDEEEEEEDDDEEDVEEEDEDEDQEGSSSEEEQQPQHNNHNNNNNSLYRNSSNNNSPTKISPSKIYPESIAAKSPPSQTKSPAPQTSQTPQTAPRLQSPNTNTNTKSSSNNMNEDDAAAAEQSFNMLNSPMDTLLLLRKRNSQHANPLPAHSPSQQQQQQQKPRTPNSNSKK